MKKILILAAGSMILFACNNEKTESGSTTTATDSSAKQQPAEFADAKYVEWGKQQSAKFTSGDIDGWLTSFADNAVYSWSSGDSLAGKTKITEYWKNRRSNVIDSIQFTNEIWLPVKVNQPQTSFDSPGVWLLSWYMVNVKYKNGKKLMFWVHTDYHYDNNDKIDRAIQYMDRAPINAALGVK